MAYLLSDCTASLSTPDEVAPGAPLQTTPSEEVRAQRRKSVEVVTEGAGVVEGVAAAPGETVGPEAVILKLSMRSSKRIAELVTAQV